MPTYTYQCTNSKCSSHGVNFEVRQSMKDDHLSKCEVCGDNSLKKIIVPANITFVGDEWFDKENRKERQNGRR